MKEDISFVMGFEFILAAVAGGGGGVLDRFGDAAVEAFHQAVGLRPEGADKPMLGAVFGADLIEGMPPGGLALEFVFHVDPEAIG